MIAAAGAAADTPHCSGIRSAPSMKQRVEERFGPSAVVCNIFCGNPLCGVSAGNVPGMVSDPRHGSALAAAKAGKTAACPPSLPERCRCAKGAVQGWQSEQRLLRKPGLMMWDLCRIRRHELQVNSLSAGDSRLGCCSFGESQRRSNAVSLTRSRGSSASGKRLVPGLWVALKRALACADISWASRWSEMASMSSTSAVSTFCILLCCAFVWGGRSPFFGRI